MVTFLAAQERVRFVSISDEEALLQHLFPISVKCVSNTMMEASNIRIDVDPYYTIQDVKYCLEHPAECGSNDAACNIPVSDMVLFLDDYDQTALSDDDQTLKDYAITQSYLLFASHPCVPNECGPGLYCAEFTDNQNLCKPRVPYGQVCDGTEFQGCLEGSSCQTDSIYPRHVCTRFCSRCSDAEFNSDADGETCAIRVQSYVDGGLPEDEACANVASQFPSACACAAPPAPPQ